MVIASLDRRAADAILERLPTAQAESIRRTIMSLSENDVDEQRRAIREFIEPIERTQQAALSDFSVTPDTAEVETGSGDNARTNASSAVRALTKLSDQAIAACVYHERVATIAALVAMLPGKRAAHILRLLDPTKQPQILNALAQGMTPNPLVVDTMTRFIVEQNSAAAAVPSLGPPHGDALQAILTEVNEEEQEAILGNLALTNPLLARRLGWQPESKTPG